MNCEHWRRQLLYLVFSLAFASSLMMMSYIHGSTSPRVPLQGSPKNESSPITAISVQGSPKNQSSPIKAIGVHNKTHEGDSIPLVDFKDLGKSKKRVLLLVTVGSAPQRSDRRQGIRSTWWKHCQHQQVNIVIVIIIIIIVIIIIIIITILWEMLRARYLEGREFFQSNFAGAAKQS